MRILFVIVLGGLLMACSNRDDNQQTSSQPSLFNDITFQQALAQAEKQEKPLLIDFYSDT